ncbi:unnamed protein product [Allacma fusca]|uniref:Uncharacterized protein n=1 Tax=Allacma fusca TaxID=39272 RepID=A0A8J2LJ55_9HEXA|nr:unnamed protein product [Allacma fusca]
MAVTKLLQKVRRLFDYLVMFNMITGFVIIGQIHRKPSEGVKSPSDYYYMTYAYYMEYLHISIPSTFYSGNGGNLCGEIYQSLLETSELKVKFSPGVRLCGPEQSADSGAGGSN